MPNPAESIGAKGALLAAAAKRIAEGRPYDGGPTSSNDMT
jgi:hypothetical protein